MAINLDCIRFVAKMKWELVANDILRVHFWNVNGCCPDRCRFSEQLNKYH